VRRIVAQSVAWAYEPRETPAGESVPLDLAAPQPRQTTVYGIRALEFAVRELPEVGRAALRPALRPRHVVRAGPRPRR
jgi:hypothetical protein